MKSHEHKCLNYSLICGGPMFVVSRSEREQSPPVSNDVLLQV